MPLEDRSPDDLLALQVIKVRLPSTFFPFHMTLIILFLHYRPTTGDDAQNAPYVLEHFLMRLSRLIHLQQYIVELVVGCNHITCRCKTEFCFKCGCKTIELQHFILDAS